LNEGYIGNSVDATTIINVENIFKRSSGHNKHTFDQLVHTPSTKTYLSFCMKAKDHRPILTRSRLSKPEISGMAGVKIFRANMLNYLFLF